MLQSLYEQVGCVRKLTENLGTGKSTLISIILHLADLLPTPGSTFLALPLMYSFLHDSITEYSVLIAPSTSA